jgi:hypothetical protein
MNVDEVGTFIIIQDSSRRRWTKLAGPPRQKSKPIKTTTTSLQVQPGKRLPHLSYELTLQILEMAAEPFIHEAVLTMTPNMEIHPITVQLGVHKVRDWADIAMYQVCQETRRIAIGRYGLPERNSFPSRRALDTLVINLDEEGTVLTGSLAKPRNLI